MSWKVQFTKKSAKEAAKLPHSIKERLAALVLTLQATGPVQGKWKNYSKLSDGSHYCHLKHRYVACWRETEKGIEIEVYYVGTRENAPY